MSNLEGRKTIRQFNSFRNPKKPFKRELTSDEIKLMHKHFWNYSFSINIDADNNIILGGGKPEGGIYYITEDDLLKLK